MATAEDFGEAVREVLAEKQLSLREAARRTGISHTTIADMAGGKIPQLSTILAFARRLELDTKRWLAFSALNPSFRSGSKAYVDVADMFIGCHEELHKNLNAEVKTLIEKDTFICLLVSSPPYSKCDSFTHSLIEEWIPLFKRRRGSEITNGKSIPDPTIDQEFQVYVSRANCEATRNLEIDVAAFRGSEHLTKEDLTTLNDMISSFFEKRRLEARLRVESQEEAKPTAEAGAERPDKQ